MGKKIVLTGVTLTDPTAPRLANIDAIETDGSIFLFDWTHPSQATFAIADVPTNGATIPNLLAELGEATIGAPVTTTLTIGGGYDGTKALMERSTKGGLHTAVSPTLADSTVTGRADFGTAVNQYLIDNPSHEFYYSVWGYTTKAPTTVVGAQPGLRSAISATTSRTSNYLYLLKNEALSGTIRYTATVGASFYNGSQASWNGTIPATASAVNASPYSLVPEPRFNYTDEMRRAQGGFIHYRSYLEDLTVSSRTYAEVDAIDYALYTQEVTTAGGRYYGDTYTDPATIP